MIDWTVVFLGVIAVAVLAMAAIQVGAIVYAARLAQRVNQLTDKVDQEIKPLLANLNAVGAEAAKAASLATAQVERADRLFADISGRVGETAALLQEAVVAPAREGFALVAGLKAAVGALRDLRHAAPARSARQDDEDPLFIG